MKKRMLAVLLVLLVCTVSAFADGIRVNPRETIANRNLSGDVTNILILLQDGDATNLCAIASINGKSGKGVITQLDPDLMVNVPEAGDVRLGDVYSLGDAKSRGFLTVRTVNQLLDLNIATYVALDMTQIPALVDALEGFIFTPSKEEDAALGFDEDTWALDGEQTLAYMRLKLDSEYQGCDGSSGDVRGCPRTDGSGFGTAQVHGYQPECDECYWLCHLDPGWKRTH